MRKSKMFDLTLIIFVFLVFAAPLESPAFRTPDDEEVPVTVQSLLPGGVASSDEDPDQQMKTTEIQMVDRAPESRPDARGGEAMVEDLMRASRCEARDKRLFIDQLGHRHVRKAQFYKGVPIVGGEIIIHRDEHDRVYRITGKHATDLSVDTTPVLAENDALQIGLNEMAGKNDLKVAEKPSLVIYHKKLAFRYVISHSGRTPGRWQYYVDAHDGSILNRFNSINYLAPTATGVYLGLAGYRLDGEGGTRVKVVGFKDSTGNYFMYNRNAKWGLYDRRARNWEQQAAPNWGANDRAAVSCAKNLNLVQRWVKNVLHRDSFDGLGSFARANIHVGTRYVNAYWDGVQLNFGDGDGLQAAPLTSLDIVAHEYGHAITQYTSNLDYVGESGALNESFSDVMGCAVEWAYQPVDYNGSPGRADWMMGEDAWLDGPAMRDMSNPKIYGQPCYYKGQYWYKGMQDNGGVHTNSGVQNFAFYLLANGGTGVNEGGRPYNIKGLGIKAAAQVAMRANMVYLTPAARYHDSRLAWINAARDLGYPAQTVAAVWTAVGVNQTP